ncbi:MAG: hypothetical protein K1X55_16155 [Chitinophagales bacterium]|nr:hypothetical protein [Chitinophagales bacterium]
MIKDTKTGKIIKDNIGIYDVDFIMLKEKQIFLDEKGNDRTLDNTDRIKISPTDGSVQAGLDKKTIPTDPDNISKGNVTISNNKEGKLVITPNGEDGHVPKVNFINKKEEK